MSPFAPGCVYSECVYRGRCAPRCLGLRPDWPCVCHLGRHVWCPQHGWRRS